MAINQPVDERALSRTEILADIRQSVLAARPDVVGIIVFGSFARGEDWRDVDVLVVVPSLESNPTAWADTALALRRAINLSNVQVIPYSQRGSVNGLRNHSPFLLDIAVDGIVLHDQANLSEEIAAVKLYIQERGIRRPRPGSWRFPVQYRRSTPL